MDLFLKPNGEAGPLPFRLRMPDGSTRTDPSTFTAEEIAAAGLTGPLPVKPSYDSATHQAPVWRDGEWKVDPLPEKLLQANARKSSRKSLRAQYMALPKYIRGPMFPCFMAANQLLDLGMDADAREIIEYAEPPKKFNTAKLTEFEEKRLELATVIAALPPLSV